MRTRKKRTVKKFMAFCLTMLFVLSMSLTAFAAITPGQKGTITVNGVDNGVTVSAYQVISVNVNETAGQPEEPMYTWADSVAAWLKTSSYSSYINATDNSVTEEFNNTLNGNYATNFWEEMAAAIKTGTIILTPSIKTTAGTSVTFENMAMGQYLLTASGGVKIYQPTTAGLIPEYDKEKKDWTLKDATVGDMKKTEPTIEKETTGDSTVAIGDTVEYKLTVTVPDYPEDATAVKFEVGDTLSKGLTYTKDSVQVYTDPNKTTKVEAGENTFAYKQDVTDKDFVLDFVDSYTKQNAGSTLYIFYTATVNENAFETDALGNHAFLGYNNNPYDANSSKTKDVETEVYTYGITVKKVDKDGKTLAGAKFSLYEGTDTTALMFKAVNGQPGVYTYDPEGTVTELEVSSDGSLKIQGLDLGTYVLKETKAPDGYVVPDGQITIVIEDKETSAGKPNGSLDDTSKVTATGIKVQDQSIQINGNVISFNVVNTSAEDAGFELPKTGGMGTMLFTVGGILLMGGAVAMVIVISRRKNRN